MLMQHPANPANPATPRLMANVANPANAGDMATVATVATKPKRKNAPSMACTAIARRGTVRTKAKAPACRNVFGQAVASPTDKRGFVMPKISRHGFAHVGAVGGHGVAYPQGWPHSLSYVTNRHAHPLPVVTQPVVSQSRQGATMHRPPVSRNAVPAPKATPAIITATEAQAIAMLEATSNVTLAGFYLRKGNLAAARRKAVQLLKSLQVLEAANV